MTAADRAARRRRAPRNVILIGARGCGKTTVGRALAARLGWEFVDTDERIVARAGKSIRAIFADDGEPAFRQLESELVDEVTRDTQQVISAGGGAVLAQRNRAALSAAGVCIWLTAPPEELHRRLESDPQTAETRPALTGRAALDEIRHLLTQREPLYAAVAEHVVPTAGQPVEQIVETLLGLVAEGRGSAEGP